MPALTTLTAAGVPGRRRAFAPKSPTESGGGRPGIGRFTRLSAAGVPERWKARPSRSQSWDVLVGGALPRLASSLPIAVGGYLVFEIRLDFEFSPALRPNFSATPGGDLPRLGSTLAGTADQYIDVALPGTFAPLSGAFAGTAFALTDVSLAGTFPALQGEITGQAETYQAALAGALPALSGAITGVNTPLYTGPLIALLPRLTGSIDASFVPASFDHAIAGSLGPLGGAIAATFAITPREAELAGQFAPLAGVFREAAPVVLATRITLAGRIIDT